MRKLATACTGFCAAVFIAQYLVRPEYRLYLAAALLAAALLALLLKGRVRTRALLFTIPACVGMFWSWGHFMLFISPCAEFGGTKLTATVTATDYSIDYGDYQTVYAVISGEGVPSVKTALYNYNFDMPPLSPGDSFTADLSLSSASVVRGEETDTFNSRGIYLRAYLNSDVTETQSSSSIRYFPKRLAHHISETAKRCFPEDVSAFFRALLIGDRTDFYSDRELNRAASVAGLMHIVAISGMHLSFLLGFLRLFTHRGKLTAIIGLPLMALFAMASGASPSIVRAAIMQAFVIVAPLVKRENDTPTSMTAALALILCANPASCASVSLQLSFGAIMGISAFSEKCYMFFSETRTIKALAKRKVEKYICAFIVSAVSTTLGAMVFTTPLVALYFGYISLYSVLTNVLCMWITSFVFCGGFVVVLAGSIIPALGSALGWVLAFPARYIFTIVKLVSRLPFSAVYTADKLALWWLGCVYAMFILTYVYRRKEEKFRPVLPVCLSISSLCCILLTQGVGDRVAVLDVGQGACTAITQGDTAVVIDCGAAWNRDASGEHCAEYLMSQGQRDIDLLALTHLHADHCSGVAELFACMQIKMLAIPENAEDSDGMLDDILLCAESQGTEIVYIGQQSVFTAGDISLDARCFRSGGGANESGAVYLISDGDFDLMITGDAGKAVEYEAAESFDAENIELFVAGHHGSAGSSGSALLSVIQPEYAVVSVGAGNSYGHPTAEALERLSGCGAEVYRTDLSGDVIFRIK